MLNKVVLIGRLTKDPEIRFTQNQKAVCSFNLAVNRNFSTQSGEREADFINVVCWGKTAENVSKYLGKGSLIAVDGRIQTRNYENNQGQRVYVTEVVGDNVTFLDSKNSNRGNSDNYGFSQPKSEFNKASNDASFDSNKDPFADFGNSIDISDDDLPF
ncbi:MAG: single-stranded DNA-binding protein [Bacilli bacterium]